MSNLINTNIPYTRSNNNNTEISEYQKFKASKDTRNRRGKRWDENENDDMLAELKAGKTIDQIAEIHGRTSKAIKLRLEDLGLKMKEQKIDTEEIKAQLNLKDEDLENAEKRAKNKEDNNSVNLAEKLIELTNKVVGLESIILKQNTEILELKNMLQILISRK